MANKFNKKELIDELTLKQISKAAEHLEAIHGHMAKTKKSGDTIINAELSETNKLLKAVLGELKKPWDAELELE